MLNGRTAVITGGCSGIGRGTAKVLIKEGATVYALDLKPPKEEDGVPAKYIECNVTSEESVIAALKQIPGDIDILVNSAGIAYAARIVSKKGAAHKLNAFKKVLEVNTVGTFNVSRLVAERMVKQEGKPFVNGPAKTAAKDKERGVIVNIASIAAFDGEGGQVAYSASKGAIVGMTLPMARDLGRHGIRVVTVAPGLVHTPLMQVPDEIAEDFASNVVFPKRLAQPEEMGQLILGIVQSSYLNAVTVRVDGGIRLSNL